MRAAMVLLLCLSFPAAAFAWGEEGHAIIAEIAQRRLSPQAAATVEKLLGRGHSLASTASWADDFRGNGTPEGTRTANWHFVNIPIEKADYDEKRDCIPNETYGDCIVAELDRLKNDLHCTTGKDEGQERALKFAVHFVGDIHQPLHTVKELGGANGFEVGIYMEGVTCKQDNIGINAVPWPQPIFTHYGTAPSSRGSTGAGGSMSTISRTAGSRRKTRRALTVEHRGSGRWKPMLRRNKSGK
jgi:hypothetical protein